MKKLVHTGPLALSLVLTLSACEMKTNLDEMHGATVEMNQTTGSMNDRMTRLKTATGELYDALRQGDSLAARRSALDHLVSTSDPARKLSEAAKYFMSFEFQLWTNDNLDSGNHRREELAKTAAQEFFKDVQQFIPKMDLKPRPLAGQIVETEKTNLINSLNALSVTMHYLNPKQELRLKEDPSLKPLSMYSMIEASLAAKYSIETGEKSLAEYPGYVAEILANEPVAIYLLQARYNYLMALFLGKSTEIAHSKLAAAKVLMSSWTLDLAKFNTAETEQLEMFVVGILKTKAILTKHGVVPETDGMLKRMYSNMKIDATDKATAPQKVALDQKLIEGLKEVRCF